MAAASRIKGITIEIDGDPSKLTTALSKVDQSIRTTQGNLKDLDRALKLDPGNTELIKDKQQELAREISDTEKKLKTEKEALDQLKNSDGFDENSREAQNLKTQIDLDTAALKQLKKEAKDCSSVFAQKMKAMADKVKAVGDKVKEVGDNMQQLGRDLTTHVTVPIATGFAAVVKTTADFDEQMSKVKAISGANADEFDQLRDKAREMGEKTRFSATESGEAMEYMAMAGWKTEDMLEGLDGIMNLAAASQEDLGTTSDIVTDALTAFHMEASESSHFADILAAAATNANTDVAKMGESFKYVAPLFGAMGYSAEDSAIALGLMANSGIKADMAGTSLRNMIQRMANPTKQSAMAMQKLGLSLADDEGKMYSFREIMDQMRGSFSEINMSAEDYDAALDQMDQALADGTMTQKEYDKELEELNKQAFGAEGAEKARWAAMLGGTRALSGLLAITEASTEDYQQLQKAIDGSSESFAKLADGSVVPLSEAMQSGQEIIEQYDGAAAAMAATMQDNLSGQATILKSQLQELAISLGDLLMPLLREIVGKIQEFVDWLNSLDDAQKEQILKIAAVVAAIGPALLIIGKVISAVGTVITVVGTIMDILAVLGPAIGAIGGVLMGPVGIIALIVAAVIGLGVVIYQNWDKIKEWTAQLWEKFKAFGENVKNGWEKLKTDTANKWNAIKQSVVDRVNNLKTNALNAFTNLKNGISEKVGSIKQAIVNKIGAAMDFIKNLPQKALQWGKDLIGNFINGIRGQVNAAGDAAGWIADKVASFLHFSEPDEGPLKDFHTFAPDMVKLFAQGITQSLPILDRAADQMAGVIANDATPTIQNGNGSAMNKTVNAPISITVNGAPGQDVNALADIIQQKMNRAVINQKAVFA